MAKKKKTKKVKRAVSKTKKESSTTRKPSSPKKAVKHRKKPSTDGKFKKGNKASKGATGPEIKHRLQLAEGFKSAVTIEDIKSIAKALIKKAKKGNVQAATAILDRCLGKPVQPIGGEGGGPVQVQIIKFGDIDDSK